uniref:Uncharacterized protein n=1 Tax=Acrobeloides nanus TaxID=290746 RepID=A0A914C3K4_9BILA
MIHTKIQSSSKRSTYNHVMDNAAYHGRPVEKPPNVASSKGDIAKVLLDQNVSTPPGKMSIALFSCIDWLTEQSEELRNIVELNDLQQNVKHPTHGPKLIDHFFTSKDIKTQLCEHHDPIEAKHKVISLRIDIPTPKQLKSLIECYNYKIANWEALYEALNKERLNRIVSNEANVNIA